MATRKANAGHLEPVAAGPVIIDEYVRLGGDDVLPDGTPMHGAEIDRRAAAGDVAAKAAERRAGLALGEVLGSLCNMLDPAAIILSGSVVKCGPDWSEALGQGFLEQVMPPVQETPLVEGTLGTMRRSSAPWRISWCPPIASCGARTSQGLVPGDSKGVR